MATGFEPEFVGFIVLAGEAGVHEAELVESVFGGQEDSAREQAWVGVLGQAFPGF